MILVGAGGLAKSRSVRAVLGDSQACWIEGNATRLACTPSSTGTAISLS